MNYTREYEWLQLVDKLLLYIQINGFSAITIFKKTQKNFLVLLLQVLGLLILTWFYL